MLDLVNLANRKISWYDRRMLLQLSGYESPDEGTKISKNVFWIKKSWGNEETFKVSSYTLATIEDFVFCQKIGMPSMIFFFQGRKVVYFDDLQA